jgi:Sulfotransferase family
MIISHQHKFIFLKTKKTAGTAIEAALSELCGPSDVITPYREESETDRKGLGPQNYRIEHPLKPKRPLWRKLLGRPERYYHHSVGFYEHMPASRVRDYVGEEVWRSYFKFAFDRNPWDRQVSWYLYKTKSKSIRPSFERFMQDRRRAFVTNYAIYTIDGALAVDFVGRYENLQDELAKALDLAGVGQHLKVPRTNVTPDKDQARDYRSYYSDATRERVAEWYAPEIALLHYGF